MSIRYSRNSVFLFLGLALCSQAAAEDIKYLDGHSEIVFAVAVSPDGKFLVSAGADSRVVVRSTDDLSEKYEIQPREGSLTCLAFTPDSQYVLASGNLADFSRKSEIDGAIRLDLKKRTHDFISLPVRGSTMQMTVTPKQNKLIYFCGSKELLTFELEHQRLIRASSFVGSFPENTAISTNSEHFAVTSQNKVNNQSAEPCWLTVLKPNGVKTLFYQFPSEREYQGSQMIFPSNESLVLCLASGKILFWKWNADRQKWEKETKNVTVEKGYYTAITSGLLAETIWLARGKTLLHFDLKSGKLLSKIDLKIGERKGNILTFPIECLTIIKNRKLLVAGLWDGRLALIPLDLKEQESP